MTRSSNAYVRNISLDDGVVNLGIGPLRIEMVEGCGWIVHDKEDIIVDAGEEIELDASLYPIVISLHRRNQPIVFNVEQINPAYSRGTTRSNSPLTFGQMAFRIKSFVTGISSLLITK